MPKLQVTSDEPHTGFNLVWGGKSFVVVRSVKEWRMIGNNADVRLGRDSLHWTTALDRAIEQIERRFA